MPRPILAVECFYAWVVYVDVIFLTAYLVLGLRSTGRAGVAGVVKVVEAY